MKKSFMTRVLAVSLSAAMAFSLSSATSLTAPEAAAKKLPANKKAVTISLKVGKSKVLKLKNYKAWNIKKAKSNKTAVAAVANKGTKAKRTVKVTAKKKGTAKVTLTLGKRKTANSKATNYSKTIKKVVTVKVTKAADTTDTTPTDTTPADTTPVTTPTDSAVVATPGVLNISQVAATKVDILSVSFSSVVASTGAVKVSVTRGTAPVDTKSVTWNTEANGLTIEMTAKMIKGTYTVTATDGKDTTTGSVEVTDQEVKEIKFLNETALTGHEYKGSGATQAYVYYDVLDQYGESMRDTVSIQWTTSAETPTVDREKGRLTIKKKKNDGSAVFNFGDKLYVTGVYTKTGVSNSGTFSIGTEQNVDSVKFAGFVKKGETTISDKLPADFKQNEYQLLYTPFDQNGNEMDPHDYIDGDTSNDIEKGLTFISDNVLVVKEVVGNDAKNVTIKGVEYCAGNVNPGINVTAGGTVNLSAISTRTGNKSTLNFVVGAFRTLKSFEIGTPSDIVADGESVEIPYTALDADGNKMTNFKELATQSDFSKLTFNQSVGYLSLAERDDGSARLVWSDKETDKNDDLTGDGIWDTSSANGIDRPISLTAIVVGGETSNQMIYVQDKARPEAIADVDINGAFINKSFQKLTLTNFTFLDQYGRNMTNTYKTKRDNDLTSGVDFSLNTNNTEGFYDGGVNGGYVYDNGFFNYAGLNSAALDTPLKGTDFDNCKFSVGVKLKGLDSDAKYFEDVSTIDGSTVASPITKNITKDGINLGSLADTSGFVINYDNTTGNVEPTLEFVIQKYNSSKKETEEVSKKLTKSFKLIDIGQLSNLSLGTFDKFSIETAISNYDNGSQYLTDKAGGKDVLSLGKAEDPSGNKKFTVNNDQDAKVTGTYSGNTVEIPAGYLEVGTKGILTTANPGTIGDRNIKYVAEGTLNWKDLYDISSSKNLRKDASDTVEVSVHKEFEVKSSDNLTTLKTTAMISDASREITTFTASDTVTLNPSNTIIRLSRLLPAMSRKLVTAEYPYYDAVDYALADAAKDDMIVIKDQFGKTLYEMNAWNSRIKQPYADNDYDDYMEFEYLVTNIVEADGYVKNNFKVNGNSTTSAWIEGAEPGDTFTLQITARCKNNSPIGGEVTKAVQVTVGADTLNLIHNSDNGYMDEKGVRASLQEDLEELLGKTTTN